MLKQRVIIIFMYVLRKPEKIHEPWEHYFQERCHQRTMILHDNFSRVGMKVFNFSRSNKSKVFMRNGTLIHSAYVKYNLLGFYYKGIAVLTFLLF